ncbi:TetR/AcrR family transcriptional regulator [Nonomuraea sediminis]|uniref:TetR/AcrR family transcriptional regulator n=1 Tax=Nonomuraea sediminis TaxID=2835864 RepID=UPI001BDCF884|nr:TetR/AcrR family transcriptional regulator [Nonomuraea sediminis]
MGSPARDLTAAAVELFYEQGAQATTVREITKACGLTAGALYNHFTSKEELLFTVIMGSHATLEQLVVAAQAEAAGPRGQFVAIVRVYVEQHAQHRKSSRVANREYGQLGKDRRAEIVSIRRRLRDRFIRVIEAGERSGDFRLDGVSATIVARAILDMCVHISAWFHEGQPLSIAELQDRYVRLALRMVGASDGHRPE